MTIENTDGKVIYAKKAESGKYYVTVKGKNGIVLKFLEMKKTWQKLHAVFFSTETENEVDLKPETLVREITQGEVKEMVKKVEAKKESIKTKKVKKPTIPIEKLKSAMPGGKSVKVGEIAKKLKIEYRPVYMALAQYSKEGLAKLVKPGTFQLIATKSK